MNAQMLVALITGLAACGDDLVRRQVSNWICLFAFAAGISCLSASRGWHGLSSSLLGAASGFAVFAVFYWLGGMGGGDIKLMAGMGAIVGVERILAAALWTAACGGLLAAVWLAVLTLRNLVTSEKTRGGKSIPYAPAIALGSWLALLSNG